MGTGGGDDTAATLPEGARRHPRRGTLPAGDLQARERLLREAQALAQLSHPNVITIHDVGTHGGDVFIAMELVDGESLRIWMRTPRRWRETMAVLLAAGRGLASAHAAGLVHRDFEPDNVMVGKGGQVRVLDFGLARPALVTCCRAARA